jgi:very-short-patch-repair endonuclease
MPSPRPEPPAPLALERHQRRREQGIPTLTVLAGPPSAGLSLWRRWLEARGRTLCVSASTTPEGVVRDWMEALGQARSLATDAAEHLGAAAGLRPGELPSRLKGKTAHERGVLLQALLPALAPGDVSATCRGLLHLPQVVPKSAESLGAVLAACEGDALRALGAVHALVPPGAAPTLLMSGAGTAAGWLEQAARVCARACEAVPSLVVALQAERPELEAYLRGPESQARALVREGRVELAAPSSEELMRRLEALGVQKPRSLEGPLQRLAADGVPDEVITQYGEAARKRETADRAPEEADRARSAAERFLYKLLDAMPATQGLFELNARAEFQLRGRSVEVDFLSRRLRLAIEVDGYFHFREPERYRRDRRKDLALQRHGYWVLRFLADDVVARFEEIRDTVLEVVSIRRQDLGGPPPQGEDGDEGL